MYDLRAFSFRDLAELTRRIHQRAQDSRGVPEFSEWLVRCLYDELRDGPQGEPACALVRLFQTREFRDLPDALQRRAAAQVGGTIWGRMHCLTLIATAGREEAWNDPARSVAHQVIALPSESAVADAPMISRLIHQLGLEVKDVIDPDPALLLDLDERRYGVFHVPEAEGSAYIPAQDDFVRPNGVRSVVGFGGLVPAGNLFAVVLFARCPVPRAVAEMFQVLAVSVRTAMLELDPTLRTLRARA